MSFFQLASERPLRVMPIFGTRPEAIKMAPVIKALGMDARFNVITVVTAQHREMLDQVLALFRIEPRYDLDLMQAGQDLPGITARVIEGLAPLLAKESPDLVLVHGDTTTTFAAALSAFYHRIPVGHIEAGLRSGDRGQPFPEEINRRLTGILADLHLAPTPGAAANLEGEGVDPARIFITGNTIVDALHDCLSLLAGQGIERPRSFRGERPYLLITVHRRENWGEPLAAICRALLRLLDAHPEFDLVLPVHLNPAVQSTVRGLLGRRDRVHLLPPVDYAEMVLLMRGAHLILTDSGGIQEEAPALGRPVLVLRNKTERPEALAAGTAMLAGTDEESVYTAAHKVLADRVLYAGMAGAANPFGDGRAAVRIREAILYSFRLADERPRPWMTKA